MTERTADQAQILLVDDNPANLAVLCELLEAEGYIVSIALDGQQALDLVAQAPPDLILLDVTMPGMDGFEVCRRLQAEDVTAALPVLFVTARDLPEAVAAGFAAGGLDYITKPFREQEVLARVRTHLRLYFMARELTDKNHELAQALEQRAQLKGQLSLLSAQEAQRWGLEGFVGDSPTVQKIFGEIRLLQENTAPSVLITGESGTGKELIARAIHFGSARRDGPFIPVNCAALPGELADALLFGHVKGAFTGAEGDRGGHFEMAHEGTLFLDEIGEMPLELQAKLLRVLEDGEIWRLGAGAGRPVDVRVLAATNADLDGQMQAGTFRRDLYFRLARFTVQAPPLRQRPGDIALLAQHFVRLFAGEMGQEPPQLAEGVLDILRGHSFPGNVRELKNILERALLESRGGPIQPHHLHLSHTPGTGPTSLVSTTAPQPVAAIADLESALAQLELQIVQGALDRAGGNIAETARLLGTNRNRIYRVLQQAGLI
ncbi:MAG: response regulator [Candidatus Latescibacteria bacterium]|nr:response regulator [Candidatus Latescibacterota bacterium]